MRIVIMHLVIIGGGFLLILLKTPAFGLVLLIVVKSWADVRSHLKEHGAPAAASAESGRGARDVGERRAIRRRHRVPHGNHGNVAYD